MRSVGTIQFLVNDDDEPVARLTSEGDYPETEGEVAAAFSFLGCGWLLQNKPDFVLNVGIHAADDEDEGGLSDTETEDRPETAPIL